MKLPQKLRREPLVEAVFEMRFAAKLPASSVFPGLLFAKLPGDKTIERLPAAELPQQVRLADPNLRYAPLIRMDWRTFLILTSDQSVALACKSPYPGWSEFKPAIMSMTKILAEADIVQSVERFSLKYTDVVPSELGGPSSIVDFDLRIGPHEAAGSPFQIRAEISKNGLMHIVLVASSGIARFPDGSSRTGVMIDVDTIAMTSDMGLQAFLESLDGRIETVHTENKAMFFTCLRTEALEKLEPIYG
jgi:uncharacterized protein (TIGR04255 family)